MSDNYGWKRDCDIYIAFMTTLPPSLKAPLQLIKYGCSKSVCEASRCKYKADYLYCTDLCFCGVEDDLCKILTVSNMLKTFERLFSFGSWPGITMPP